MKKRIIVCPLIQKDEKYLICKMPKNRGAFPGQWGLPGGGVEENEKMIDALKREIKEELGNRLIISKITPWTFRDDICEKLYLDGKKEFIYMIYLIFDCIAQNDEIELNEEFEKYHWVEKEKLQNFDLNNPTIITFQKKGFIPDKLTV